MTKQMRMFQSATNLIPLSAEAERGRKSGERREYRKNVDGLSEGSAHALLTDKRDEDRAYKSGRVVAELVVGERKGDDGISGPRVKPPVEDRYLHSVARRLYRAGLGSERSGSEVGQRFGRSVENEADAHACREEHSDPREVAVLRTRILGAEAHFTEAAASDEEAEGDEDVHRKQIAPAVVFCKAAVERLGERAEAVRGNEAPGDDGDGNHERNYVYGIALSF